MTYLNNNHAARRTHTSELTIVAFLSSARDTYQLGSLSHLLNMKATGYQDLPEWPAVAPDPGVRNVELPPVWNENREPIRGKKQKQPAADLKSFYSSSSEEEDGKSEASFLQLERLTSFIEEDDGKSEASFLQALERLAH